MIIHTAEYRAEIKPKSFLALLRIADKTDYIDKKSGCISKYTINYKDLGFSIITILAILKPNITAEILDYKNIRTIDIMKCYIKIQVNYSNLFDTKCRCELLYNGEENLIEYYFNRARDQTSEYIPTFEKFHLHRVDYAIDLILPSQDYINNYVRMFSKAGLNKYFKSGGNYSTSISEHTKSYNYNFYAKGKERENTQIKELFKYGVSNITKQEIKNTENTFRIEIQCQKSKLKRIENKGKPLINFTTSRDLILSDIQQKFWTGSCYKLEYLRDNVIPNVFKSRTKIKNALNLIQYISQNNHTVRQAIKNAEAITGITSQTAKNTLNEIHKYRGTDGFYTCIIPLTVRANISYLPDIVPMIENKFNEQILRLQTIK